MLIRLIEIQTSIRGGAPSLNEIYINSTHIVSVSEDRITNENLINETKSLGLMDDVKFSKVIITEGNQTRTLRVVGAPAEVHNKIKKKQVLRG